tara:strand:- start:225 stop:614 length:390 start_codon:yes stop_codon:yes gene_type:complete
MNTFKWTIPEPKLSKVEKENHRFSVDSISGDPSKREIKKHLRWEKVSEKGIKKHFISTAIWYIIVFAFFLVLEHYNVFNISDSMAGVIGGIVGVAVSEVRAWNQYNEKKEEISEYLNKTNKLEQIDEGN